MSTANSQIQIAELDFDQIKSGFIQYLQGLPNSPFQDFNFSGSGISTLMDILAYNTHYNAYYLNIVANEMFLDTAAYRSSVVSHAKLLNYTPMSSLAPTATINVTISGVTTSSITLPKNSTFMSEQVNGVNYPFITFDSYTVNTDIANSVATFSNVQIVQGQPITYTYPVNLATNPSCIFQIPDTNVDTTTLQVIVSSISLGTSTVYNIATNFLTLDGTSQVYFLQEGLNGNYEIYFGDGILGTQLTNDNSVTLSYIITAGTLSSGANNFVSKDNIDGYSNILVSPVVPATQGGNKESIASIKFQAPKSFSAQNRAVTKEDYITAIQQNKLGYSFDAVNVWGGEENTPPIYGQIFVCLKPTGSYSLTTSQKQQIINSVITPISVLTVKSSIVDPDYTYITLNVNVYYDPTKTTLTSSQIQSGVTSAIQNFALSTLNTFNSTFNSYDLLSAIQNFDQSVVTSEYALKLQKRFYPSLITPTTYNLYYNTSLQPGTFLSGISSSPALQFRDPTNLNNIIDGVYIEEIPSQTHGIDTISILNPGFSYQLAPQVTILGDGTGATAHAIVSGGSIAKIVVDSSGNNYTSTVVSITAQPGDTTGQNGAAIANMQGRYGTLRLYYYNSMNVKTILNGNIGTIDYTNGIITLNSFTPVNVDNPLGQLSISATPSTSIVSSTFNGIITVDPFDPSAIIVNVVTKTS